MIHFCKLLDANTGELHRHLNPPDISEVRLETGKVIWLDIRDPDDADLALLAEEFDFHPLAIEDCRNAHQRPKLEQYDRYMFLVLYEAGLDPRSGHLKPTELNVFLGENYVVTIHRGPAPVIDTVQTRWESNNAFVDEGASYLAYLIIDATVDGYFPLVDSFTDRLDGVESSIFDRFDERVIETIFDLKRDTLLLRRIVTPLRDVFLMLLRGPNARFGERTYVYFQDVLDHLLRVADSIDAQRDLVTSSLDAYQSAVSNRTNDTMKKLTVLSTVLMTMALIAGIYGMNFVFMPELGWHHGYYGARYMMLTAGLVLAALFRWKRYIGVDSAVGPSQETLSEDPELAIAIARDRRRDALVTLAILGFGIPFVFAPFLVTLGEAPLVTTASFQRLSRGMSIPQAEAAVGHPGQITAAEDDGATLTEVYTWTNPDGSTMTARFANHHLASKAYDRLK
jgi:magnesium transporter